MKRAPAMAIVVLLVICASCLVGALVTRGSLSSARAHCDAVPMGITRTDAEHRLATELDTMVLGWAGDGATSGPQVSYGRRGAIVSWECELWYDAADTVTRARFNWWIAPDFHGRWDDDAREWLEANFL